MSILSCCGFRRRGRQPASDADLADSPEEHHLRRGLPDIQHCFDQSRESLEMPIRSRDVSMLPTELPSEDPTELGQLVVDDSDGDGEEDNPLTKTSSALNVVRTKLIRRISHENEPNRRSRASAGHSQEEVARRAELRRFRHQRIQEELKNEESNAEVGPRDAIEFTVEDAHLNTAQPHPTQESQRTEAQHVEACTSSQEQGAVLKPAITSAVSGAESWDQVHPLRPPSTHSSTSQKLAGCSYKVPRLDRVLGADSEFDIRHGAHAWEEQSALGIWLAAQGLQSRSSSIRPGGSETNDKNLGNQVSSPQEDFGGIDSTADVLLPTRCQGSITEELHDRNNSFESASFVSSLPNDRMQIDADATLLGRNLLLESDTLDIATTRPVDPSSSDYPSVLPSFQPSPDRSQSNFHHLSAEDLESLELSPFSWRGNFSVIRSIQASEGMSSYATAEENIFYSDNNASSARINCPTAKASADATSLACSGAAGFHPREAKMQTIGTRLGDALSRKKPSLNFGSRFKEDFHITSAGSGRRSFMAKMNLSVPRRSKYSSNSFGTAQSRHYVIERSSLALRHEDSDGRRLETPTGGSSPFKTQVGSFSPADIDPHSELLLDEVQSPSRRILQQWSTNLQGTFSPNSIPKPGQPSKPAKRLTKIPSLQPQIIQSCEEKIASIDLHQSQMYEDRRLVVDALPSESISRFRPGRLGRAVRSGLKKLMPSHDNERQTEFFQIPENRPGHDENEKCLGSKIVRTDTLTIASEHRSLAQREAVEYGITSSNQHLSAELASRHQQSASKLGNTIDLGCSKKNTRISMGSEMQKLVDGPNQSHPAEDDLMSDISIQPWRRLTFEDEKDRNSQDTGLTSATGEIQALRRWKSALDVPASRKLSLTWTGRSMAQSLSLGNLRD
ncbi:hypothetical protein TrVFT333_005037 [Trichoderma virens FT-333]|nr:hypothetical protein TrVFT333_005037 [Trichoderma virens FT-333]